jgi:hypothetical protein
VPVVVEVLEKFVWVVVAGVATFAWIILQNKVQKAREIGLLAKVKKEVTTRNALAAVGGIAILLFIYQHLLAPSASSSQPQTQRTPPLIKPGNCSTAIFPATCEIRLGCEWSSILNECIRNPN